MKSQEQVREKLKAAKATFSKIEEEIRKAIAVRDEAAKKANSLMLDYNSYKSIIETLTEVLGDSVEVVQSEPKKEKVRDVVVTKELKTPPKTDSDTAKLIEEAKARALQQGAIVNREKKDQKISAESFRKQLEQDDAEVDGGAVQEDSVFKETPAGSPIGMRPGRGTFSVSEEGSANEE